MRDESILYVPSAEKYCVLNHSAAVIWEALVAPQSEDDLAAVLCETFEGANMDRVLSDVRATLDEMREMSLIEEQT